MRVIWGVILCASRILCLRHHWRLEHRLPQVAPAVGGAVPGTFEAHTAHAFLHQLHLVPGESVAPEPGDLLAVGALDLLPEELDAVEVWAIRSVLDHLDSVQGGGHGAGPVVDAGVVPEDGDLPVLACSQPQPLEEVVDVICVERLSQLVHLQEAAAPLADGREDSHVLLIGPLVREL